jgi:hypothetical protein
MKAQPNHRRAATTSKFQPKKDLCSLDSSSLLHELFARSSLATMAADAADTREALPHLERCRQIVSACENWRGLTGSVERAEAVVAAAQGDYDGAETRFGKAIATFQRYRLP